MSDASKIETISGNFAALSPLFLSTKQSLICAAGSSVLIISSATGNIIGQFDEHKSQITSLVCSSDFSMVLSVSIDNSIFIWNPIDSSKILWIWNSPLAIYDILCAEDLFASIKNQTICSVNSNLVIYVVTNSKFENSSEILSKKTPLFEAVAIDIGLGKVIASYGQVNFAKGSTLLVKNQANEKGFKSLIITALKRRVNIKCLLEQNSKYESNNSFYFLSAKDRLLTYLTSNANKDNIIGGHDNGEIVIWHGVSKLILDSIHQGNGKENEDYCIRPISTILHWHAHAVTSLTISNDGLNFFSGGEEGVLVIWNISSQSKTFVPRLGAPISQIALNRDEVSSIAKVAVVTNDNCIRIINTASLKEEWVLRTLCLTARKQTIGKSLFKIHQHSRLNSTATDATALQYNARQTESNQNYHTMVNSGSFINYLQSDRSWNCLLIADPRTGTIVCNGYPGQLQSFDVINRAVRDTYQIVDYTRISKKEFYSKMYVPSIIHYAFATNSLGSFMATVDVRKGEELDSETSLKFWEWNDVQNKYSLSSQMDSPHGSLRVSALAFSSSVIKLTTSNGRKSGAVLVATAAVDGLIKLWRGQVSDEQMLSFSSTMTRLAMKWICSCSFKYRDCPVGSLSFSEDGSLLAASYQNLLTLWDPSSITLRASLVASSANQIIYSAFIEPRAADSLGGGAGQSYIVIATRRNISVFDLLSMKAVWNYRANITNVAVAQHDEEAIPIRQSLNDGWIAIATTSYAKNSSEATQRSDTTDEDDDNDETDDLLDESNKSNGNKDHYHQVYLFGLSSSSPLVNWTVNSKVNSVVFNCSSNKSIIVATENCELLELYYSGNDASNKQIIQPDATVAKIPAVSRVPGLQVSNDTYDKRPNNDYNNKILSKLNMTSASISTHKSGVWLKDLFDESTDSIPPVSSLFDSFMGSLLPRKNKTNNDSFSLASHTMHYDPINSKSLPTNHHYMNNHNTPSNKTNTIEQLDEIKGLFDVSLVPYFLQSLSSSNTSTADLNNSNNNNNNSNNVNSIETSNDAVRRSSRKRSTSNMSETSFDSTNNNNNNNDKKGKSNLKTIEENDDKKQDTAVNEQLTSSKKIKNKK
eukprot:gene9546-12857_t